MKENDFISSKLRQIEALYLAANNKIASLQKTLDACNEEALSYKQYISDVLLIDDMKLEMDKMREEKTESDRRCADLEDRLKDQQKELDEWKKLAEKNADTKKLVEDCKNANVDFQAIIKAMQKQMWGQHTDQSKYLNGDFGIDEHLVQEMGFENVVEEMTKKLDALNADNEQKPLEKVNKPKLPTHRKKDTDSIEAKLKRNKYSIRILKEFGMDTSYLPEGATLIHRKDKATGDDVWYVRMLLYKPGEAGCYLHEIGRFNIKNGDPMCSKHPDAIVKGNPILPSLARFYLENKIRYNLSESNILEMLKDMEALIPQSSINKWMHQIMSCLRERLQTLMLEVLKQSKYTNNDETRILVRNLLENGESKYKIEYIHAALSLEKKLVVMLYEEGSRSHDIPEEQIFTESDIRYFTADRAPLYEAVVKDLKEKYGLEVTRTACWFHGRHYLVEAFVSDKRMKDLIELINYLFYIERESNNREHTPEQRLAFRLKYSRQVVTTIFKILKRIKAEEKEYGAMVMRAVNYILEDEKAFKQFLRNGLIEMHNISIERCFRHIAMGRRNWMHTGSHDAAQNLAFMYSLYESCKMNKIHFGTYLEDILTRIMKHDEDYLAMLPCNYVPQEIEHKEAA